MTVSSPKALSSRWVSPAPADVGSENGLRWHLHAIIFLLCFLAIASRRLSLFTHPVFFAEDGVVWFADAYSLGWLRPLLSPAGGYLNTFPRLIAGLAQWLPLAAAPLFMNIVGAAVQALPVNVLLLRRSAVWGPLSLRSLLALTYLLLPNVAEIHVVLTNAHFHLALLAFLLLVALPPQSLGRKTADGAVLLVSGLTDPFCFMLLPVAVVLWFARRTRWALALVAIEAVASAVQLLELSFGVGRLATHLGASLHRFLLILGGQVYSGALLGAGIGPRLPYRVLVLFAVSFTALVVYCFVKSRLEMKLFIAFGTLLFLSGISRPLVAGPGSAWVSLAEGGAPRYWFFPMLVFVWCLVWCLMQNKAPLPRAAATGALLVMIFGAARDWRLPDFPDVHFDQSAQRFAALPEGAQLTIPVVPEGMALRLERKGPVCRYPPITAMDPLRPSANVDRTLGLSGWVVSADAISRIVISIDGQPVRAETLQATRPDVDRIWPAAANRDKGWSATLDLSALPPGPHQVLVRAIEQGGCQAEVEAFPITKLPAKPVL